MSATLADAIVDRLTATLPSQVSVYDTIVPGQPPADPQPPGAGFYCVVHSLDRKRTALAIDGVSRDTSSRVQVTSTAWFELSEASPGQDARALSELVQSALLDWVPDIDGQVSSQVVLYDSHEGSDESTPDRHVAFAVDIFSTYGTRIS